MARAPIYKLAVFTQVTLQDVYARVADLGLDVDAFIAAVLDSPSGDRNVDFVEAFTWSGLADADVRDVWKKLAKESRILLAHPANEDWAGFHKQLRRSSEHRDLQLLRPVGVRTLPTTVQKTGWDHRRLPTEGVVLDGALEDLVRELHERIRRTIGGEEYLGDDEVSPARALTVLATTMATVLVDEAASKTDDRLGARILRADIYEGAVEGAKLGDYFQVVRRLLELHHDEHLRVPVGGPGSELRDFGFIEYGGRKDQYMRVNVSAAKRWLDPALYC